MPFVVRFVDKENCIREEFLDFILCDTSTTGYALSVKLVAEMRSFGLDIRKLLGQCYDGAGNMAGKLNGAATLVQQQPGTDKGKYFHCAAHALNLCIVATSKLTPVSNMWSVVREVALFFSNSPKRQQLLQEIIEDKLPDARHHKLVSLCRTRRMARNNVFLALYPAVVDTLTFISGGIGWNRDSASLASSLLSSVTQFTFLATFTIASKILKYSATIAVSLQKRSLDIITAY